MAQSPFRISASDDDRPTYLMALHANSGRLWYALSNDGASFEPPRELLECIGDADRDIVAVGWVSREKRLLGLLYGAGEARSLDRNRIFARWLQRKLVVTGPDGKSIEPAGALGPDRLIIPVPRDGPVEVEIGVLAEDGLTRLGEPFGATLIPGAVYRLHGPGPSSRPATTP